jgi:hypothetical protein
MIFVDVLSHRNIINCDMLQWTVVLLADRAACNMNTLLKICVFISSCDEQTLKCSTYASRLNYFYILK